MIFISPDQKKGHQFVVWMAEAISGYLEELGKYGKPDPSGSLGDCATLIDDLKHVCFQDLKDDEMPMCSSLLFSEHQSTNLLEFIRGNMLKKELGKTREQLFDFIQDYIKLVGRDIVDHALSIFACAFDAFRRDQTVAPRVAALQTIRALLGIEELSGILTPATINPRQMVQVRFPLFFFSITPLIFSIFSPSLCQGIT